MIENYFILYGIVLALVGVMTDLIGGSRTRPIPAVLYILSVIATAVGVSMVVWGAA